MRLHLRAHLTGVRSLQSQRGRDLVVLDFEAVGQPELPPIVDLYAVDHPVGATLLRLACEALGTPVGEHRSSAAYVAELETNRSSWREVTIVVSIVEWQNKPRLAIQRVNEPKETP